MADVFAAVQKGDLLAISKLGPTLLNVKQENAMHVAVRFRQLQALERLFKLHPEMVTHQNTKGRTVLHHAVKNQDVDMVVRLVRFADVLVDMVDANDQTPLQHAVRLGFSNGVVAMLCYKPTSIAQICKFRKETLLHLAVNFKNIPVLSCLLAFCSDELLTTQDECLDTPLGWAVNSGSIEMVKLLLLKCPAAVDIANSDGHTPAMWAAYAGENDILFYLIEVCPHLIHTRDVLNQNLLFMVSKASVAKRLLALNPRLIDDISTRGETVLGYKLGCDDKDLLPLLLESKPSLLLHRDKDNVSSLHMASQLNIVDDVNAMLSFKPNLVDTDKHGNTVLHVAVKAGKSKIIATVFTNCISNLQCENSTGQTPMCLAVESRNKFVVRLFEPHVIVDRAIALRQLCIQKCGIDLQQRCIEECVVLNNYMLPELTSVVFQYLNIASSQKKRKLDHV